ncbi:beta-galactosidase [Medicago truncatula]|uniref:Beta-galactosidase n=1 Tax=Medicago truncatula TaxID=3880 RepID=G7JC82_MEDTR|nr:beta-galactosidase [Medicago truncatula]
MNLCFILCLVSTSLTFTLVYGGVGSNVSYDGRSLIIDGQRKLLISASIHYPRSVPAMWPALIQTAKEGGIDVIETYVFWNGHELSPGNYYFGGRFDLVQFAKVVQDAGMYLILRIGPFVAAEWNFGGVPVWLHYIPGTVFRTYNQPFMHHMEKFTTYIVNLMKKEKLFASQGGPIILSQIENEYGYYENYYKEDGKKYALWAAKMAVSQNTSVPWIMCQQWDAPDPVIDTCNSFYCDQFTPTSPKRPKMWTENWPGWFKTFGGRDPHRPVEDVAFSVARFFQKGGSLNNYYMYHGGTNFGRTAGGPFITTSYDYDAPIDEYGLPRLPKWGHLKELHKAIKLCEHVLLYGKSVNISLGPSVEADIYTDSSGACAAFISNVDDKNDKKVVFRNASYHLPAWSVSILPDCKNVVFNTAKVSSPTNIVAMIPEHLQQSDKGQKTLKWDVFKENPGIWGKADFVKNGFVDHINTTKDTTDYLWHTTSILIDANEEFLKKGSKPALLIESKGHTLHAFVNQKYQGTGTGNGSHSAFTFKNPISLRAGKNEIAILSLTVGLQTAGPFYDFIGAGVTSVKIIGLNNRTIDLSSNAWAYKIGVLGEHLSIYQGEGMNSVKWTSTSEPPKGQALTWYKAIVDAPSGDEPVGLDMLYMGKGLAWLNGEEIGRYWPRISEFKKEDCVQECDYRGKFNPDKCDTGCGEPSQKWYHVPRSWFKPSGNVLVIFEEKGGDPTKITFVRHCHNPYSSIVVEKVCVNKNDRVIKVIEDNFKTNLCHGLSMKLAVEAICS